MASLTPSSSHKYVTNAASSSSSVTTASKSSTKPRYFGNVTLEMIDDFLKPLDGKPSQPKIKFLPPTATGGAGYIERDEKEELIESYYLPFSMRRKETKNNEYATQEQEAYNDDLIDRMTEDFDGSTINDENYNEKSVIGSRMSQVESITTYDKGSVYHKLLAQKMNVINETANGTLASAVGTSNPNLVIQYDNTHIYAQYKLNPVKYDERMTIFKSRQEILDLIRSYTVCIIQGGTGCGKTTQVPQYIFDEQMHENKYCNIIITQPRRIAAVSVAQRVCTERSWDLGTVCGYQIGLDRRHMNMDTRICYVTTGILLQKLIIGDIDKYTHIIIDEVHERGLDVDFVLLVLKILITRKNLKTKLILMSATIDCELFSKYYQINSPYRAPVFRIEGLTYHVDECYLDDLKSNNDFMAIAKDQFILPELNELEPKLEESLMAVVVFLLQYFDKSELETLNMTPEVDRKIRIINGFPEQRGSVLIFVPGMNEIKQLENMLKRKLPNANLEILPLHSDIVIDQQKRVFVMSKPTYRKVIISTSIAESSITVPDIKYVIDFCLTKELWCDPFTNYTHLRVEWTSQSSIEQRKGRAGRVSNGTCYRLISRLFKNTLLRETMPEIHRVPLTKLILNVKRLKQGEPKRVLSLAINPPNLDDVERSILLLKEAGALTITTENGLVNPNDGELTYAGEIMAALPIDIKLSKLILLGHAFGKLRECIIIAAALSNKTFFTCYFKSNLEAYKAKWYWSQGTFCDAITILNAFNIWDDYNTKGKFADAKDKREWAKTNMIDLYRLQEVAQLKIEIERRLQDFKIVQLDENSEEFYLDDRDRRVKEDDEDVEVEKNNLTIKILLCGAFYPNYYMSEEIDENDAYRMVSGKNLKSTVMIKGLPINEGVLYHDKILTIFKSCASQLQVHYENSKAYVEFKNMRNQESDVRTIIGLSVYLAVQMRLLRIPLVIERFNNHEASERMLEFNRSRHLDRTQSIILNRTGSTLQLNSSRMSLNDSTATIDNADNETINDNMSLYGGSQYTGQLRSSIITPCNNRLVEYLSNPECLIKNLRTFPILITDVVEFGHFWAHLDMPAYKETMVFIQNELNSDRYKKIRIKISEIQTNMLVVTDYLDPTTGINELYRAKIVDYNKDIGNKCLVKFVDFGIPIVYVPSSTSVPTMVSLLSLMGNEEEKSVDKLYFLSKNLETYPFQAIECKITNMKRSYLKGLNNGALWSKKASAHFAHYVQDKSLSAKIYSIVDNCIRIELFEILVKKEKREINLLDELLSMGFVEKCEESQVSKSSHQSLYEALDFFVPRTSQARHSMSTSTTEFIFKTDDSLVNVPDNLSDANNNVNKTNGSLYSGFISINGPYSPLEMKFYPVINIGRSKGTYIERDSINYVALDDEIESKCRRLLVAAEVTLNASANRVILRKTSLMPKIMGLSSIMCLLFTPTCEVRLSPDSKSFTGALCGLGFDRVTKRPLYTDNDIECVFDVNIDCNEFAEINTVRRAINLCIGSHENALEWTTSKRNLRRLQNKARDKLLSLVQRERMPTEIKQFHKPGRWDQLRESQKVCLKNEKWENTFYTLHNIAALE